MAMAEVSGPARRLLRFGNFELEPFSGELRKAGVLVGLQEQSRKVLLELVDRPGDLVTREQLRQRLWPDGTFVDFEHGLNAVINRLRETLGDSAESPRFIQTVPRRGYRFIAPVEGAGHGPDETPAAVPGTLPPARPSAGQWRLGKVAAIALAAMLLLIAASVLLRRTPRLNSPSPTVEPLTSLAGTEAWPAFAPDGEQVAFAWSGEKYDNTDLYVTLVGSTSVRRLTTDPREDYAPSWSPDGRRIAFLRRIGNAARIHVMSALGGPDLQVSDFPVGATMPNALIASQIGWSPDGRYVVAGRDPWSSRAESAGIYLIPIDGGEPRAMTRPASPAFDFSPAFSPDGRRVAYASCESPGLEASTLLPERCLVRSVEVDARFEAVGAGRTLTVQPVGPAGLAWSRDGKSILFVGEGRSSANLLRLWIDGTLEPEIVELAGSHAEHPATVASRDRLLFSRYDWDAHLYRFTPGHPPERVAASSSFEGDAHFSPDGRQLAFTSGRSGKIAIWVAAANGSHARQLTSDRWAWQGSPNWSPDGRVIAFDAHDADGHVHIWTIPAEGGYARRLTSATGDQTAPTWSRDGKWIYYSDNRDGSRDIWRVPASGGTAERLTHTGTGFLAYETWDGTSLLYQPKFGDSPLLVMPLSGGGALRSLADCVRPAAFAPAGRRIVYVACGPGTRPALHSLDVVNGRDQVLGTLEHFPPAMLGVGLAVSPDGKTILFRGLPRRGSDLMLIENFR
jgi:Tol biopolymer transport system component/DNA-binding winged helix-turn-helix (wHTH) protein